MIEVKHRLKKTGIFRLSVLVLLIGGLSACSSTSQPTRSIFTLPLKDTLNYRSLLNASDSTVHYLSSFDLTKIAYRKIFPQHMGSAKALCVFIHGTSAQSKLYLPLADTLKKHNIATVLIDLRGHGLSGGETGKTHGLGALARDLRLVLNSLKRQHPELPIILGGHSLGAGLCLKYLEYFRDMNINYVKPDGLLFMAGGFLRMPDCNPQELARLDSISKSGTFATISPLKLAAFLPGGLLGYQFKAIHVQLPTQFLLVKEALQNKELTTDYSLQFFLSAFPTEPSLTYRLIKMPVLLLAGKDDELIPTCHAIYSYKKLKSTKKNLYVFHSTNHINIIWNSAGIIANWITQTY